VFLVRRGCFWPVVRQLVDDRVISFAVSHTISHVANELSEIAENDFPLLVIQGPEKLQKRVVGEAHQVHRLIQ
jgi:hypothetical protein